jgi:PKD repeat protein
MPDAAQTTDVRTSQRWRAVLIALALVCAVLPGVWVAATAAGDESVAEPRTWVIDAVDDEAGNRWESVDTRTSTVTIAVGDTVEWQFDRAGQGHDLTSKDYRSIWIPAIGEHRAPGDEPIRHTFTEPGTFMYVCSIHETVMTGVVIVADRTANQDPTAQPIVSPLSGPAPLTVHATANAADPDGAPGTSPTVSWDFGAGEAPSATDHSMYQYATPGQYVIRLRVSDGNGGLYEQTYPITVTEPDPNAPEPPSEEMLPAIDAQAATGQQADPRAVEFSTQVTTTGTLSAFAYGLEAAEFRDIAGRATLVRRRGETYASLSVTGARPSTRHNNVHVHEQSCSVQDGGAHFRFDETKPFAEPNEIWPLFTSDATGASGLVEVTKPVRAGPKAVAMIVHDPDNAGRRIGCADLGPSTAGLAYSWDFGDGTTGTGADPDHTYAAPGTYTATVTVSHLMDGQVMSVSDSVRVAVGGTTPPSPTPPSPTVPPKVDTTPPRISPLGPRGTTSRARPTVKVRVRDRDSSVRKKDVVLRVDGRKAVGMRFDAKRGIITWKPTKPLRRGRHVVSLVVRDAAGNKAAKTWWFTVKR